jgi:hypothetical protein
LSDSNLDTEPTGKNSDIGKEIDIIIGYKAINDLSMELVFGQFIPGSAFGSHADNTKIINFKLDYKFNFLRDLPLSNLLNLCLHTLNFTASEMITLCSSDLLVNIRLHYCPI